MNTEDDCTCGPECGDKIRRLRAALERVAKLGNHGYWEKCEGSWPDGCHSCCTEMAEIARAALKDPE